MRSKGKAVKGQGTAVEKAKERKHRAQVAWEVQALGITKNTAVFTAALHAMFAARTPQQGVGMGQMIGAINAIRGDQGHQC